MTVNGRIQTGMVVHIGFGRFLKIGSFKVRSTMFSPIGIILLTVTGNMDFKYIEMSDLCSWIHNTKLTEVSPSPHHSDGIYFLSKSDFFTLNSTLQNETKSSLYMQQSVLRHWGFVPPVWTLLLLLALEIIWWEMNDYELGPSRLWDRTLVLN